MVFVIRKDVVLWGVLNMLVCKDGTPPFVCGVGGGERCRGLV